MRRSASVPSRRCSMVPQRSILRNTGPNRVSERSSQRRSACTGQVARVAQCGIVTRRRLSRSGPASWTARSTAVAVNRTCSASRPTSAARPRPAAASSSRRAVAHAGQIARAGGGHAQQGRSRRGRPAAGGAAAGRAQQRGDRGIRGGGGEAGRAVVVGDRRGAAAERAAAQRFRRGGEERHDGGGCGRERGAAAGLAPGSEAGPVGGVEPGGLGGRRATCRRARGGRGRADRVGGSVRLRITHHASPCPPCPPRPGPVAPPPWPGRGRLPARRGESRGESAGSRRLRQAWQRRGKRFWAHLARLGVPANSVR